MAALEVAQRLRLAWAQSIPVSGSSVFSISGLVSPHYIRTWENAMTAVRRLLTVGGLSLFVASCGGSDYMAATAPTPTPVGPSTFTLSGTISEVTSTGLKPLAGAQVSTVGLSATTNTQGFYTLSGLEAGPLNVAVTKAGYQPETRTARFPGFAISGFFDVEIVRESDIHTLFGTVSELSSVGRPVPVEGVEVAVMSCNAVSKGCLYNASQTVKTDKTGSYRFQGLYAGKNNFLWITKQGYDVVGLPPIATCDHCNTTVTLDGDTQFDVQLVRR